MKCAYQPFPTQRMEEILEINRKKKKKKKGEKRKSLGKEKELDFSAGSRQWHGGTNTDSPGLEATVEVIGLYPRWASEERDPQGKLLGPCRVGPALVSQPARTPYCVDPC